MLVSPGDVLHPLAATPPFFSKNFQGSFSQIFLEIDCMPLPPAFLSWQQETDLGIGTEIGVLRRPVDRDEQRELVGCPLATVATNSTR
jgi:hypothetical protein